MVRRLALIVVGMAFVGATHASAQDRPTVFIHGLGSGPQTWEEAVARLTPQLAITPYRADLDWRSYYGNQATELEHDLGALLTGNVVAVGHSNGGLVARQWVRNRDVGALITLGSPNQGAPIVDHIFDWLGYLDSVVGRIANVNGLFARMSSNWWWLPAQWLERFNLAFYVFQAVDHGLVTLGFDLRFPVLPQMQTGSSFMRNLNTQASHDQEAAETPSRVAIVSIARDFDQGGPFRILAPDSYDTIHQDLLIAGFGLAGLAGVIEATADVGDIDAFDLAARVWSVAEWFLQFEEVWCRYVSDPSPLGYARCMEHDGIVPAWSQFYDVPRLPLIVLPDGPIHLRETRDSDQALIHALTNVAQVAVRTSVPPPPPPDPGPPPPDPEPITNPPPPPPGRYALDGSGACYWNTSGYPPDECAPAPPPGRFKLDLGGGCYWEPNDYPPDQCSPAPPPGRYKIGPSGCYWDPNDGGPDQCLP